jgi:hypothetical protein
VEVESSARLSWSPGFVSCSSKIIALSVSTFYNHEVRSRRGEAKSGSRWRRWGALWGIALSTPTLVWGLTAGEAHALDPPQNVPRLNALGRWNLEKLGAEPFEIGVPNSSSERSLAFFVPEEIAEGQGIDFLINLRLSLELASQSGPGFGVFNVFVNGRAGEQVSVLATRNAKGEIEAKWSTVDLFFGPRSKAFRSRRAEVDVRNFTQLPGVEAGLNKLSIQFEQGGRIEFAKALVREATGIESTHARPPELTVEPQLPEDQAVKGKPFEVKFKLGNTGTVPARKVSVELESSSPKLLSVEEDASHSFERLLREKEVSFRVLGRKYGDYRLTLKVGSANANRPQAVIGTPIVRGESPGNGIPWGPIALSVGLIGLAGWGISRLLGKRTS